MRDKSWLGSVECNGDNDEDNGGRVLIKLNAVVMVTAKRETKVEE